MNNPTTRVKQSLTVLSSAALVGVAMFTSSCAVNNSGVRDSESAMQVSVPMQKMALYKKGILTKTYPISTSKFGLGSESGSYRTPLGKMEVAEKVGHGKPAGAVFKSRKWTGEVVKPNSPGRDPIVSRILWLKGLEKRNENTYRRCIYIHGTAAERDIGKAASYGCIRMKSRDVIDLYNRVGEGASVYVTRRNLPSLKKNAALIEEPIQPLPVEAKVTSMPLASVDERPLWNEVGSFKTGYDVLAEDGFTPAYIAMPVDRIAPPAVSP